MKPKTGTQFEIRDGAARAVITEVGAHIRLFEVGGRDVIVPFDAAELAPASHGALLAPWPNRIRDGKYTFEEEDYSLALSEPSRHNAIHGLVNWLDWHPVSNTESAVELATELAPSPGYPFRLRLTSNYEIAGKTLTITTTAKNLSDTNAPYGIGFHPWLSPGAGKLDDAQLRLDAGQWVPTDERLLPTGACDIPAEFDFRTLRTLGKVELDDAFLGATFDKSGRSWVHLKGDDGATSSVWMEQSLSCWQLCTGDHVSAVSARRTGLAAEPMTCIADAFRTGDNLITLAPEESYTVGWGLMLS